MGMMKIFESGVSALRAIDVPKVPVMSRALAQQRNSIGRLDISGASSFLDGQLRFENAPVDHRLMHEATLLVIRTPLGEVTVAIEEHVPNRVTGLAGAHPISPELAPSLAALALEHILTADLDAFEADFDTKIEILSVLTGEDFDTSGSFLSLNVTISEGHVVRVYVMADQIDAIVDRLASRFPQRAPRPLDMIKVKYTVIGPLSFVPRRSIMSVRRGDHVILCSEWNTLGDHLNMNLRNNEVYALQESDTGLRVDSAPATLQSLRKSFENGRVMSSKDTENGSTVADPMSLVTVELHRAELSVTELGMVQNGDVLDFDIAEIDQIRICADGAPIAEGRLVKIDDVYGVQVTKLL